MLVALAVVSTGAAPERAASSDMIASQIERWSTYLQINTSTDETWQQIKQVSTPVLETAKTALRDGRRLWALQRLATAEPYLVASQYASGLPPADLKDTAAFEAAWKQMGSTLRADLEPPSPSTLDGVRPAAVRAIGEAALPQVRIYYDASLDYGRNTTAQYGLLQMGIALGQRDVVDLCRKVSEPSAPPPPPVRALSPELDALEAEFLAAYRPPAAIDKHDQFIGASAALKEARELDAAGLRYGALLRYLQAVLRSAPLRQAPGALDAQAIDERLGEFASRLSAARRDDSIGKLFLEIAQSDIQATEKGKTSSTAATVAQDVLPRYFAALEPASAQRPKPASEVTVTLVRWPYT